MDAKTIEMYKNFREDERNSAFTYRSLAEMQKDARIAEVYNRMAAVEIKHAEKWEELLTEAGVGFKPFVPEWRTKVLIWLARKVGPELILPSLQAKEKTGVASYARVGMARGMAMQEQSHGLLLDQIQKSNSGGMEGSSLALMEGRHRSTGGNALRAAVLGANDGLVSNLSLVMGVAGAAVDNKGILIAGMAGLLAGASSMALGEWLSVQSSRELYANQIKIETEEIDQAPEEEAEELALIYEARGVPVDQAQQMAAQILSNRDSAVDVMAREELGIDPEELGGSAWTAAITSFVLFAIGAIIPVAPFIFLAGSQAILTAIILSTIGLFLIGTAITLFTGRSVLYSGARMMIFGLLAAAITFGIGRLIGISLAG
ncbi:MAG: VIT1/CCC1 transporter family protein [Bellilinea sp.]